MSRHAAVATAATIATMFVAEALRPQLPPVRLGVEFQINSYTPHTQAGGVIGAAPNGDFAVLWLSNMQDGSTWGAFGQLFDSSGIKKGVEFQVGRYTLLAQGSPDVAMDSNGDMVVVWDSYGDGSGTGVFARRIASSGTSLATEFQINIQTLGMDDSPAIARDAAGRFVVAWESHGRDGSQLGVFARRFSPAGVALGVEFQVNSFTAGNQWNPDLDLEQDGDFLIVWQSDNQDGSLVGVFGQRFNSSGAPHGPEFQLNQFFTASQAGPKVGIDDSSDFVVVWDSLIQDGDAAGIFARRFDSSGAPKGPEQQVNVDTTGDQRFPSLAVESDGDFAITWTDSPEYGISRAVARHFKASGAPTSGDMVLSTASTDQEAGGVAFLEGGDFVVAWSDDGVDGSAAGVFGQRFDVPPLLDIDGNGQITGLTDGLLVLRFLFGFTGVTLTSGAVGQGCTRCDSAEIVPYLRTLV
jgi:hypothetical protein